MTYNQANDLLTELATQLARRKYYSYNSSIIQQNQFKGQLDIIAEVGEKYKPKPSIMTPEPNVVPVGNPRIILDAHGIAIINSILGVNSLSTKMLNDAQTSMKMQLIYASADTTKKLPADKITHQEDYQKDATVQARLKTYQNYLVMEDMPDFGGDDQTAIHNHIKTSLANFQNKIKDVLDQNKLGIKYADYNISVSFDYYVLKFLCGLIKAENDLFDALVNVTQSKAKNDIHYMANYAPLDASTCRSVCTGLCSGSCSGTCNGCGGQCTKYCSAACETNCANNCSNQCKSSCDLSCNKECNGCSGQCTGGCIADCTAACGTSTCTSQCGAQCTGGCYGLATGQSFECGCGGKCTTTCGSRCSNGVGSGATAETPPVTDTSPNDTTTNTPGPSPDNTFVNYGRGDTGHFNGGSSRTSHPSSGYHSNGDGTGYWVYTDAGGNDYRSETTTDINGGANHTYYDANGNPYTVGNDGAIPKRK